MFLDAWVIVWSVYEYFILLLSPYIISVFSNIFKKTNSILSLKLFIYLFIYYSDVGLNVRLDYDSIYTILLFLKRKKKSSFFKNFLDRERWKEDSL